MAMVSAHARKVGGGELNWVCSSATYGIRITTWITLLPLAIATNYGELPQSHCQSLMTMPRTRDDDVLNVKQWRSLWWLGIPHHMGEWKSHDFHPHILLLGQGSIGWGLPHAPLHHCCFSHAHSYMQLNLCHASYSSQSNDIFAIGASIMWPFAWAWQAPSASGGGQRGARCLLYFKSEKTFCCSNLIFP